VKESFGAAGFGFLLLLIGAWADVEALRMIGIFIMPLAVLYGGVFKTEDSVPLKITMLAIGGLLLVVAMQVLASGLNLSSFLG
jgi:hypothetical protein